MTLPYELGEMRSANGEVLRYEVEVTASDIAIHLSTIIREYPIYKEILEKTRSSKTDLYFQTAIKEEIYSVIKDLCVLRWYRRNNVAVPGGEEVVLAPPTGICLLLDRIWPDKDIPIRFADASLKNHLSLYYRSLRSFARRAVNQGSAVYCRWKYKSLSDKSFEKKGTIAVQYAEGIDLQRRSDIVWYPESGIDSSRVLLYFAWPDHQPVDKTVIQSIEKMGMDYVALNIYSCKDGNVPVWYPSSCSKKNISSLCLRPKSRVEKWIHNMGEKLINEINYWSDFYGAFNIRLHLIVGSKDSKYIAQGIAFDRHGQRDGLMFGKERSELQWPPVAILGWYPVDVFFTWSPRAVQYLNPNVNHMLAAVSTGYPNDFAFNRKVIDAKKLKDEIKARGVDFIVSLFDNVHGPDIAHSTANMEKFYLAFLNWLLDDPTVVVLIKSKKSSVLQRLPRVLPVLLQAESTGRCLRLEDEFGRLSVDASFASDMSVGIGISSSIIEAAIAGCRGVHCDLTNLISHEFYQWGYEKLIYDDLDRLIVSLKGFKTGDSAYKDVGDWTPFLDKLDPFRDGSAGERMGTYLRWCLEGFDDGLNRDDVILGASEQYRKQWGADKVAML
ncbi:MAG: hypothetical protein ABFD82_05925 [Syntrophaceae bacterium]